MISILIFALLLKKLSCLGIPENLNVSTLSKNSYSDSGVNHLLEKFSWHPVRVFDISSERRSNSKEGFTFVVDEFS